MPRKFDREFKLNAVKLIREKDLSIRQASDDLGVGKSTLDRWVRELEKYDASEPSARSTFDATNGFIGEDEEII